MDAKRMTEEIKLLTGDGEQKQENLVELQNNLKTMKNELERTEHTLYSTLKQYQKKLKSFGTYIYSKKSSLLVI